MPMIDVTIPEGALKPEAEDRMLKDLTDILIRAEGYSSDNKVAQNVTWLFLHRPAAVYVAGARSPRYRIAPTVPGARMAASSRMSPRESGYFRPKCQTASGAGGVASDGLQISTKCSRVAKTITKSARMTGRSPRNDWQGNGSPTLFRCWRERLTPHERAQLPISSQHSVIRRQ
jgi:hypothetical protein